MKMKRVAAVLLTGMLMVGMTACGDGAAEKDAGTAGGTGSATESETVESHYMDLTPEEVQEKVAAMKETAEWDEMALESGILDEVDKILEVEDSYTLRIGTPIGGRQCQTYLMAQLEAYLEASTDGKVQVENYPLGQLGTNAQTIEGVLDGSITGWSGPIDYLYNYAQGVGVVSIPFLFEGGSYQAIRIFQEDPTMDEYLNSAGFWNVCYGYDNSQVILSTKKYETINDFKGSKIWSLPTEMEQKMINAIGATPVLLDSSDVSVAFQNGNVDGGCAGLTFFTSFGIEESAKYVYKYCPYVATPVVTVFSYDFMMSLPEDLRQLIVDAGDLITDKYMPVFDTEALNAADEAVSSACEVVEVSDELIADMKEACSGIGEEFCSKGEEYQELYDKFSALVEADQAEGHEKPIW